MSLETLGERVRTFFQKVKTKESFSQISDRLLSKFHQSISHCLTGCYLTAPHSQSLCAAGPRWGLATIFSTDAGESGSTFCLARIQCHELEGVKRKGMEWGENKRQQEKEIIFLTPTMCHWDVWALLRIRAGRKKEYPQPGSFISFWCHSQHTASSYMFP